MLNLLIRRVAENRPAFLLMAFVMLSLVSLGFGAEATIIGSSFRTAVSTVAYPFIIGFDRLGGGAQSIVGIVTNYNEVQTQNEQLRYELAMMQQRIVQREEASRENARLRSMLAFQEDHPRLRMTAAKVMGVEKGVLTIDIGSMNGVKESMCVMTKDGVVGVVTSVTPFSSTVNSLHHADCKIAVKVERSRVRGVVSGSGNKFSHMCELQYIGESDDVMKGDVLITSEESRFPSGFLVGRVGTAPGSGSLLVTALVEPAVNPYALDEVFVVLSAAPPGNRPGMAAESNPVAEAYAMPDTRTMQERYAP